MNKGIKKSKYKYVPLTIYLVIFIVLIDVLALVLYTVALDKEIIEDTYYPGKTDPVKIEEMPVDNSIKGNEQNGCSKDLVKTLEKEADNVKFGYEPYEKIEGSAEGEDGSFLNVTFDSLKIVVENVTPNIIVEMKDNLFPSSTKTINYNSTNEGRLAFEPRLTSEVVTYYVTISSNGGQCGNQVIKKLSVEVPMVNKMITYDMCDGIENVKECAYFAWEDYALTDVRNAINNKNTTTTTMSVIDEETTTTTVESNLEETTTKVANKEEKQKEEKGKIKFDNVMKLIVAIGLIAIIIVITCSCVISIKKRG